MFVKLIILWYVLECQGLGMHCDVLSSIQAREDVESKREETGVLKKQIKYEWEK